MTYRKYREVITLINYIILCSLPGYRWEKIKSNMSLVEGSLSLGQDKWLFNAAKSMPDYSIILEIGSFMGKSSCSIAYGCLNSNKHLYCIDPFNQNNSNTFDIWENNIYINGLVHYVTPLIGKSQDISKIWCLPINMLFIDGSHEFEDVMSDFRNYYPYVVKNGLIIFHDSTTHPGVIKAWNEYAKHELCSKGRCGNMEYGYKL